MSRFPLSLFVNEIWEHFHASEIRGINIDGRKDIIFLAYADGLILLCNSPVDITRKLNMPQEYCAINFLEVNTKQTKILEFHKGQAKKISFSLLEQIEQIKKVTSFNYLGTTFPCSRKFILVSMITMKKQFLPYTRIKIYY